MATNNEVRLTGNLGKDADYRPNVGTGLTTFSLACNRYRPTDEGYQKIKTEWFRCNAWGRLAERVAQLKKGERVMVTGRLENREWQDTKGVTHYVTEIVVESLVLASSLTVRTPEVNDTPLLSRTPAPTTPRRELQAEAERTARKRRSSRVREQA